jgi:exodeoxyribonuclease VII small subunit
MSPMARKTQNSPKNYEEAMAELEAIVAEIERGQIGLEDVLVRYERGVYLIQYCQQTLSQAEKQIELVSKGPDGSLQATPLAADQ